MSVQINEITVNEAYEVNGKEVYKDHNELWIAREELTSQESRIFKEYLKSIDCIKDQAAINLKPCGVEETDINIMEKENLTVTEGRIVTFTPGESTAKEFKNKVKKTYPAIITEVNQNSVDLTVFGVKETHYMSNIQHVSDHKAERSFWDWPERK